MSEPTHAQSYEECPLCGFSACPPMARLRFIQELALKHGLVFPTEASDHARNIVAYADAIIAASKP